MIEEKMKEYQILIAGRGGQGILLAGYLLGLALVKMGYYVVNSEEYSAETRGGDSMSELIVSKDEEPFLIRIRRADIGIFMYVDQLKKYGSMLHDDSIAILDSTYIKGLDRPVKKVYMRPFSKIAIEEVGTVRVANIVMLGYLIGVTNLVDINVMKETIANHVSEKWREENLKALEIGYKYGLQDAKS